MSTVVDICNLALSRLGDRATVTSIDPPEGSAQADHCARFYAIARDTALEEANWTFATRREALTKTTFKTKEWLYAYFKPNECLHVQRLVHEDQPYVSGQIAYPDAYPLPSAFPYTDVDPNTSTFAYAEADNIPYEIQTDADGREIILTDIDNAHVMFTFKVVDPSKFSTQFINALSYLLASHLAGPVLKGRTGERASAANYAAYEKLIGMAGAKNANQNNRKRDYIPQAMARRGVAFPRTRRIHD